MLDFRLSDGISRRRGGGAEQRERPGLPDQIVDPGGGPGHRPAHLLESGTHVNSQQLTQTSLTLITLQKQTQLYLNWNADRFVDKLYLLTKEKRSAQLAWLQ